MTLANFMDAENNFLLSSNVPIGEPLGAIPEPPNESEMDGENLLVADLQKFQDFRPLPMVNRKKANIF